MIGFSFYDNPKNPNKAKERKYFQVYVLWFNNGEETKHKQTKNPQYWLELNDLSPVIGLAGFRAELQKRADRADQSVLFFLAGANFWEKHAKNC